jgi:hypothetical protein
LRTESSVRLDATVLELDSLSIFCQSMECRKSFD